MGLSTFIFTLVWSDRKGKKHCLVSTKLDDLGQCCPETKWIEIHDLGKEFVSELTYAVMEMTSFRDKMDILEHLVPYFEGKESGEWNSSIRGFIFLQDFFDLQNSSNIKARYCESNLNAKIMLKAAKDNLKYCSMLSHYLWYLPFYSQEREESLRNAKLEVERIVHEELLRKQRKMAEWDEKMANVHKVVNNEYENCLSVFGENAVDVTIAVAAY